MPAIDTLAYEDQVRILREVIMGTEAADESADAAAFREQCVRDKAAADKAGHTLIIPDE